MERSSDSKLFLKAIMDFSRLRSFCSFAPSSLLWGGGMGDNRSIFHSVQDCLRTTLALQEAIFVMQITSDLLSHVR